MADENFILEFMREQGQIQDPRDMLPTQKRSDAERALGQVKPFGNARKGELTPIPNATPLQPNDFQNITDRFAQSQQRMEQISKAGSERVGQRISAVETALDQPRPAYDKDIAAQRKPLPAPPTPTDPKEFQKFSGMAIFFAALAGGLAKAPLTAALNGYAAGVQGYMKGDAEKWHRGMEDWKNKTEEALQHNQNLLDDYKLRMADRTANVNELKAGVELELLRNKDQMGIEEIRQKGLLGLARLMEHRQNVQEKMQMYYLRMRLGHAMKSASQDEIRQAEVVIPYLQPDMWSKLGKVDPSTGFSPEQRALSALVADRAKGKMLTQGMSFDDAIKDALTEELKNPAVKDMLSETEKSTGMTQQLKDWLKEIGGQIGNVMPGVLYPAASAGAMKSMVQSAEKFGTLWDRFDEYSSGYAERLKGSPADRGIPRGWALAAILEANPGAKETDPEVLDYMKELGYGTVPLGARD